MPKGKKFDAAEKHFAEKCVEWKKQIKELEAENKELHKKLYDTQDQLEKIQKENDRLIKENKCLMELKNMSASDIKTLVATQDHNMMLSKFVLEATKHLI